MCHRLKTPSSSFHGKECAMAIPLNVWWLILRGQGVRFFANGTRERVKSFSLLVLLWVGACTHIWVSSASHRMGSDAGEQNCVAVWWAQVSNVIHHDLTELLHSTLTPLVESYLFAWILFSPQVLILLEVHFTLQLGCFCLPFVSVEKINILECFINSFSWRLLGPSISV